MAKIITLEEAYAIRNKRIESAYDAKKGVRKDLLNQFGLQSTETSAANNKLVAQGTYENAILYNWVDISSIYVSSPITLNSQHLTAFNKIMTDFNVQDSGSTPELLHTSNSSVADAQEIVLGFKFTYPTTESITVTIPIAVYQNTSTTIGSSTGTLLTSGTVVVTISSGLQTTGIWLHGRVGGTDSTSWRTTGLTNLQFGAGYNYVITGTPTITASTSTYTYTLGNVVNVDWNSNSAGNTVTHSTSSGSFTTKNNTLSQKPLVTATTSNYVSHNGVPATIDITFSFVVSDITGSTYSVIPSSAINISVVVSWQGYQDDSTFATRSYSTTVTLPINTITLTIDLPSTGITTLLGSNVIITNVSDGYRY